MPTSCEDYLRRNAVVVPTHLVLGDQLCHRSSSVATSTAEPARSHLAQQALSSKDKAVLAELEKWLPTARFEKCATNVEICVDKELPTKWALLMDMDLVKRV